MHFMAAESVLTHQLVKAISVPHSSTSQMNQASILTLTFIVCGFCFFLVFGKLYTLIFADRLVYIYIRQYMKISMFAVGRV